MRTNISALTDCLQFLYDRSKCFRLCHCNKYIGPNLFSLLLVSQPMTYLISPLSSAKGNIYLQRGDVQEQTRMMN